MECVNCKKDISDRAIKVYVHSYAFMSDQPKDGKAFNKRRPFCDDCGTRILEITEDKLKELIRFKKLKKHKILGRIIYL